MKFMAEERKLASQTASNQSESSLASMQRKSVQRAYQRNHPTQLMGIQCI